MIQTSILERKVFDGRKRLAKEYPFLSEVLAEAPCERCQQIFSNCDVTGCAKLTAWLIAAGGN